MLQKIIALALAFGITTGASASDNFQYWSYWIGTDSGWQAASQGAGTTPTQDQMVQGWRFVETGVGLNSDQSPSTSTRFKELCRNLLKPKQGFDRVALVIDFGKVESTQTPPSPRVKIHCLSVKKGTRSIELLNEVTEVRENAGFICALANYPESGCGEPVAVSNQTEVSAGKTDGNNRMVYGLILLFGAGVFISLRARNRRPIE